MTSFYKWRYKERSNSQTYGRKTSCQVSCISVLSEEFKLLYYILGVKIIFWLVRFAMEVDFLVKILGDKGMCQNHSWYQSWTNFAAAARGRKKKQTLFQDRCQDTQFSLICANMFVHTGAESCVSSQNPAGCV